MSIQFFQLLILFLYGVLLLVIIFVKPKSIKILACLLIGVIFFVNPVRFKQGGGEILERSVSKFDSMPERIEFKKEGFEESHARELQTLQQQSKDKNNEIHN